MLRFCCDFVARFCLIYIKCELKEDIEGVGKTILSTLRNKSLEEFNKEEHISELKSVINRDYIIELQRRIYSWNVLGTYKINVL
ncbi:hypothetical protein EXN64_01240 [Clostridium botulinum]|uniref:hypothetical protein n=1 Tax=Clostridium botulinum TaxID=1491 RepID=UPI0011CA3714|nr:hypothetical protein [Clostridium botulinum]NFC27848.1 hypothetical protein [Clostridium botulinum]NFC60427.1 hypothetical protein [Clostridium botulinum]NFE37288.1 hypothetical protein [Clostridium botulinum]NFE40481.1 hypothetical protein [Clostridium botulinum]